MLLFVLVGSLLSAVLVALLRFLPFDEYANMVPPLPLVVKSHLIDKYN